MNQQAKISEQDCQRLHIGTSGWSYRHWKGLFYPKPIQPNQYLEYYATQFSCVEVNASFYRLPQSETIENWFKTTPDDFILSVKMNRSVTHFRKLMHIEQLLQLFFERFSLLKNKLGPILLQLPPQLIFEKPRVKPFFQCLKQHNHDHRFALEGRHHTWHTDEALELMHDYKIAWVISDYNQPHDGQTLTSDFVYMRFHGPKQLYASKYSAQYLKKAAIMITSWLQSGKAVWIFFNNDADAYAIDNARQLKKYIVQP